MKDFIVEMLKKFVSTVLFAGLMFVASYSFITKEFPPKIENMKKGITSLQNQLDQIQKLQKAQLEKATGSKDRVTNIESEVMKQLENNGEPSEQIARGTPIALPVQNPIDETRVRELIARAQAERDQGKPPAGHLDAQLRDALISRIRDLETRVTQLEMSKRK